MKLRKKGAWHRPEREFDVDDAVQDTIDSGADHDGAIERAAGLAREGAEMTARLIAKLHAKGVLSDDDVLDLVGTHNFANVGAADDPITNPGGEVE